MLVRSFAETYPGKPEQVARVRNEVGAYLDGCAAADDVVLIVSEFAFNAVLHSLSRLGTFSVCVQLYPGYVYVEVEDDGDRGTTRNRTAGLTGWTSYPS